MSNRMIAAAKQKRAAAERRLQELRMEIDATEADLAGWVDFLERAETLSPDEEGGKPSKRPTSPSPTNNKISVRRVSAVGAVAGLLMEKGPLSLKGIAAGLRVHGHGQGVDDAVFRTRLNSAMWRRQDLFERGDDGNFSLKTRDIEFTDE